MPLNRMIAASLMLLAVTAASAAGDCIDAAPDRKLLESCANQLLVRKQADADAEYARLARDHAGDEEMMEILRLAKDSYQRYINIQCVFESAAVAGTTAKKEIRSSLPAQKAFYICIARVADGAVAGMKPIIR